MKPVEVGVQRPDDEEAMASLASGDGGSRPQNLESEAVLPPLPPMDVPGEMPRAICTALLEIMSEKLYVKKSGWNHYHKYWFATVDDVYAAVRPLLVEAGLTVLALPEGAAETFITPDGNAWVKQNFRIQLNCGGSQYSPDNMTFLIADIIKGPQTFGGLRSYAKKYWLREALMIETGEGDIDNRHGTGDDVAGVVGAVAGAQLGVAESKAEADKIVLALDMAESDQAIEQIVRSEATNLYPRLTPADRGRLDTALSTARDRIAVNQAPPQ
jgi:hypothetical protein